MHRVKGVCEAMRLAGLRSMLFVVFTVAIAGALSGCDNPFDPLQSSDKIQGLTYFDFAATQERWDSDPEWDGLQITLNYYNEFGDSLSFHDKSHKVQIDLWSEESDGATPPVITRKFLATKTVTFPNSDDFIRIPVEYYSGLLGIADPPVSIKGCLEVRIFPPQQSPQRELVAPVACDVEIFTAEEVVLPP